MAQIYKKGDGNWAYRVFYKDVNGKRHSINQSHFKKKLDAQNAARATEIKKSQVGLSKENESITFTKYFNNWIKVYKLNRFSHSTQSKYTDISKFINKHFGNIMMKKITKADYQKMLDEYSQDHVKSTVSFLNSTIRSAIKDAIEQKIIFLDFTRNAIVSSKKKSKEIKYFELEEAYKLRNFCLHNSDIFKIVRYEIALSLATGMRYGEIVGLTWSDIDFDNNTIDINKTYDYKNNTGFLPTKTPSSVRKLDVDPVTMKLLKQLRFEQAKLFFKQKYKNKTGFVFINSRHEIPGNGSANKSFKLLQKKLNIKADDPLTFHALRHTHASILIANNVSLEYVSARLGHSNTMITSKTYVHLLKNRKIEDTAKTVKIFS